ncbi:MAG: phosphoglucosamine mutase [Gammaproteobacteria bacterium]|nr:MAG: phosphoglucosamine mutase [Pseudomonadota bacterium]MBC6943859.1 phosphoglucosamine mutase [Gammaproteobacteria bacterium]MCE7895337.1 phosphoglucosamine mutase [Gammaproteobacteria bacterium PRO8]MDL1880175.1 phosphoglucosamine mutase [Gammaproteobacteria bacterium PRO2]MCL4776203.1 phosphoglucosamine mutase [Gammaproteobacteria bacterium]
MSRQFFGTDGIRGQVGQHPMTAEFALRLASAAARVLAPDGGRVMIGKDTRVSGYMFESALEAGFVAAGMDVTLLGPLPTPGIAYMTQASNADLGVVISASHNPYADNGIKFFDRNGGKLSDSMEEAIEAHLGEPAITRDSGALGRAKRLETAIEQYQRFCVGTVSGQLRLDGLKAVVDCAHGAGYKVAPRALTELGAEIVPIGCSPNGRNINEGCGSTQPELLTLMVKGVGADIGIAFDGDGDRVVMVDHLGNLVDGDQILYVLAADRRRRGQLDGPVVGTLMSNLGLEIALGEIGAGFHRAKVGDRYVLELLRETGGKLGGETSGHILCLDKTTTGDGLVTALQVLAVMRETGRSLADLTAGMRRFPQVLINVRTARRLDLGGSTPVRSAVDRVKDQLGRRGRVVLRPSGTEPVVRVMVEGEDEGEIRQLAEQIARVVADEAA